MRLGYTILYVKNVTKTLAFYNQAFGLETKFLHESGDFGELNTGTTALAFSSLRLMTELKKNPSMANPHSPCFEIALVTEDVELALQKAIDAGAKLVQGAQVMPWGQTTAYVSDLDGFLVELCTAVTG